MSKQRWFASTSGRPRDSHFYVTAVARLWCETLYTRRLRAQWLLLKMEARLWKKFDLLLLNRG